MIDMSGAWDTTASAVDKSDLQLLTGNLPRACELCPRRCGVNRSSGAMGICGATDTLRLARAALHMWEEPPISGEAGSGTIFFSGCSLKCIYCQNHEISTGNFGIDVSPERLVEIMLELQEQGALNINLVTATHYAYLLPNAVAEARKQGLRVPIVYNTSGYERVEAVRELGASTVDIWLTDFKYGNAALGKKLSHVDDYPLVAGAALQEMIRCLQRAGGRQESSEGILTRGIIVRHLVLPGHADDSCRVLDLVHDIAGDALDEIDLSIMNQYTPNAEIRAHGGQLARGINDTEYEQVLSYADELGFPTVYWQEGGTVDESFVPAFDTTGVLPRAENN